MLDREEQDLHTLEVEAVDGGVPRLTTTVLLTVEVMDCQEPDISVLDDKLLFTCHAEGQKYQLDLKLLHDINTKVTTFYLPTILL